jgi:Uma2 family endonuclease
MIEADVRTEDDRFELLEGRVVTKDPLSPIVAVSIGVLHERLRLVLPAGWHIREQSAITTADSGPEPDLAIVRGARRDYTDRHPGPEDIAILIEVAESSLAQDRELKGRLYGRAGLAAYWIVNVIDRQIEVYSDPTGPDPSPGYRARRDYRGSDVIPLQIDGHEVAQLALSDVLP